MTHTCARTQVSRVRRDTYPSVPAVPSALSHAEISRLAYSYWEARGYPHGSSDEDWYRAETELLRRRTEDAV